MRLRRLKRVQLLKVELSKVWDYFSSPHNLREITPIWLNFKVLTVMEDKMYEGMIIEYTVSPFMEFSLKWITEITHLKEPYYFVDEQRFGPYRFWQHHHIFKKICGGIEMTDIVHYVLPFYPLGELMGFYVEKKLDNIFDFRKKKIDEIFNQ